MRKTSHIIALAAVVLMACAGSMHAQANRPLLQRTIAEVLDSWVTNAETHVVPAADAMPGDKYSFAPAQSMGEFKGVRTFAQQVKHLAANNYGMAALILGQKRTPEMESETGPDSVRTKTEIMEYLKGSFNALHEAVATINERNAVEPIASPSPWQKTRVSFAEDAVVHSYDHYGQMVEYLRMNGIIPPDSRPKKP